MEREDNQNKNKKKKVEIEISGEKENEVRRKSGGSNSEGTGKRKKEAIPKPQDTGVRNSANQPIVLSASLPNQQKPVIEPPDDFYPREFHIPIKRKVFTADFQEFLKDFRRKIYDSSNPFLLAGKKQIWQGQIWLTNELFSQGPIRRRAPVSRRNLDLNELTSKYVKLEGSSKEKEEIKNVKPQGEEEEEQSIHESEGSEQDEGADDYLVDHFDDDNDAFGGDEGGDDE